jgi:hypothetical protein
MNKGFNLDFEMNKLLTSQPVKSVVQKTASVKVAKNDTSYVISAIAEMSIELNKRGFSKSAASLKQVAKSLVDNSKNDIDVLKVGQLYGLV